MAVGEDQPLSHISQLRDSSSPDLSLVEPGEFIVTYSIAFRDTSYQCPSRMLLFLE